MSFTFRPAQREGVGLIILLSGPSGGGKTWSALALATGMAGGKRFAVVDTERGRAKFYADRFSFDHCDLEAPFTPARYLEAIVAADDAGYPVIVVDSFSHEMAGEGGILDMQEAEFQRMGGRENMKMASWIRPKTEHKALVYRMLQCKAHLILALRAEDKIDMVKEDGRTVVRPKRTLTSVDGWIPICEKRLPFEATASFLLLPGAEGVPRPIKLPEPLKPFFPLDKPITEEAGRQLAAWAKGGASPAASSTPEIRSRVSAAKRNVEEADCTYCNGTVAAGDGFTRDGRTIHEKCRDAMKKERDAAPVQATIGE